MRHELKMLSNAFEGFRSGTRRFVVWKHDRDFAAGDELRLREWDAGTKTYTGRILDVWVVGIVFPGAGGIFGLAAGFVAMSVGMVTAGQKISCWECAQAVNLN